MSTDTIRPEAKSRRPLPLAARRAAWERVWDLLLAHPPDSESTTTQRESVRPADTDA